MEETYLPTPLSATGISPILGSVTMMGKSTISALPFAVGAKVIGMVAVAPFCSGPKEPPAKL